MSHADAFNATLAWRTDLNPRVALFHVQPDAGFVADFVPGQFVQLGMPKDPETPPGERVRLIKRSYSIASAPRQRKAYELCLAQVDTGLLTPKLWPLEIGARLWCDNAPKGHFTLERIPHDVELVVVATGTGIAPFISMLREHGAEGLRALALTAAGPLASATAGSASVGATPAPRWRRFTVIHGCREASDLAYDAELRAAAMNDPRVRYIPVLSRAPVGSWSGLTGRVQVALEARTFEQHAGTPLDARTTHVLLCGNPDMIRDVRALLEPRGFTTDTAKVLGTLHFERYW